MMILNYTASFWNIFLETTNEINFNDLKKEFIERSDLDERSFERIALKTTISANPHFSLLCWNLTVSQSFCDKQFINDRRTK